MIKDTDANIVHFSSWLYTEFPEIFTGLTDILKEHCVEFEVNSHTNDLWCRDYMPIQIDDKRFVGYTYRPDYLWKRKAKRKYITDTHKMCKLMELDAKYTDIVIDGGNVVKAGNRIIMTEKVFAENPEYTPKVLQKELEKLFECELLFLPWDRAEKYGHSDGIVKEISADTVLMTNYADFDSEVAAEMAKRLSQVFHVETLCYDTPKKDDRSWAYINFLSIGNLIVLPQLGIDHDQLAYRQICDYYPHCTVRGLNVVKSVACGGALNCITWCRKGVRSKLGDYTGLIMNDICKKKEWLEHARGMEEGVAKIEDETEKKITLELVQAIRAAKNAHEAESAFYEFRYKWERELARRSAKDTQVEALVKA